MRLLLCDMPTCQQCQLALISHRKKSRVGEIPPIHAASISRSLARLWRSSSMRQSLAAFVWWGKTIWFVSCLCLKVETTRLKKKKKEINRVRRYSILRSHPKRYRERHSTNSHRTELLDTINSCFLWSTYFVFVEAYCTHVHCVIMRDFLSTPDSKIDRPWKFPVFVCDLIILKHGLASSVPQSDWTSTHHRGSRNDDSSYCPCRWGGRRSHNT